MACRAVLAAQVPSPNQNPATIPRVPILQVWIGKDRRRTFPAPTESNVEALEFADGTVRSPTRTTVRSWKEMHERYRPRRVRQDPAGLDEMRAKLGPDR
jgi:hypothetical protein